MPRALVLLIGFLLSTTLSILAQQEQIEQAVSPAFSGSYAQAINGLKAMDTLGMPMEDQALWNFYLGYSYNLNDQQDLAYQHMLLAKQFYTELRRPTDVKDCNMQLLTILSHQNRIDKKTDPLLAELDAYLQANDTASAAVRYKILREMGSNYLGADLPQKAKAIFEQSYALSRQNGDSLQMAFDLMNIGSAWKVLQAYDSALAYTKNGLPYLLKIDDSLNVSYNYNNQAEAYKYLGRHQEALAYYKKADSTLPSANRMKSRVAIYDNLIDLYEQSGAFEMAYRYAKERKALVDSINDSAQNLAIEEYRTKYETAETEKQLLVAQQQKRQNRNLAIALGVGLAIIGVVGLLLVKNARRKRLLAEQEKKIESQEKEKLLKEQELHAIDAMIAGQEKERQRIASDLHDNVGGTLSAAKMQFEHLRSLQDDPSDRSHLFEAVTNLLNAAYQEIRGMAHTKNSGVMAKDGLLPAVEKLAGNISSSQGLKVEVIGFGLTTQLDSALEINIFRMIQELLTNVIKHAQASEAFVSITQHEDSLNIMVEDNGLGFDSRKLQHDTGMGLGSIERRVEYMEGSMEVDSTLGKGTSISIDIPL